MTVEQQLSFLKKNIKFDHMEGQIDGGIDEWIGLIENLIENFI